jgi:peptidoglycan/xylan/chitin deacetylase (PgdA/CDA1 family)
LAGHFRFPIGWVTAVAVGVVFMLGVWLHPELVPFAPSFLTNLRPKLAQTAALAPVPPPLTVVAVPTGTPTGAEAVVLPPPTATSEATSGGEAGKGLGSTPQREATPAALVPVSDALAPVVTPTPPVGIEGLAARKDGVPILMYHYIRVNPVASDRAGFILSVTPADFALQMQLLAENGFHTVTMAQVRDYIRKGTPLPPKPIALTFDDGYDDAYTVARPILERYHQTATFFIVTGFLDHPRYMTWAQVEALDREGMEIGSHTVHHASLPHLSLFNLRFELTSSRSDLERHLGHPVLDFCYPGGELNQTVVDAAARAGYLSATTTKSGVARPGNNPLELPRLRMWGGMTLRQFASIVGQPAPTIR